MSLENAITGVENVLKGMSEFDSTDVGRSPKDLFDSTAATPPLAIVGYGGFRREEAAFGNKDWRIWEIVVNIAVDIAGKDDLTIENEVISLVDAFVDAIHSNPTLSGAVFDCRVRAGTGVHPMRWNNRPFALLGFVLEAREQV